MARAAVKTMAAVKIDRGGGSQLKNPCCTVIKLFCGTHFTRAR